MHVSKIGTGKLVQYMIRLKISVIIDHNYTYT